MRRGTGVGFDALMPRSVTLKGLSGVSDVIETAGASSGDSRGESCNDVMDMAGAKLLLGGGEGRERWATGLRAAGEGMEGIGRSPLSRFVMEGAGVSPLSFRAMEGAAAEEGEITGGVGRSILALRGMVAGE